MAAYIYTKDNEWSCSGIRMRIPMDFKPGAIMGKTSITGREESKK